MSLRGAVLETLTAIKRAGADLIITYHAKDCAVVGKGLSLTKLCFSC